ncbi:substrate-binding periplasmic protein [Shewanella waksmanii]|uniref:substrate-binding periplasmic protein n=1 Tax=Shewanella waksmanii TaxID=213783 RepID=UPI003734F4D7
MILKTFPLYRLVAPLLLLVVLTAAVEAKTLKVAATDWCPQSCQHGEQPGYIIDIVEAVFADSEFKLAIDYYPWTRAVRLTEQGHYHMLLGPTKTEAPNLRFPAYPVGQQKMCFFTKADSDWQYQGLASLKDQQIGVVLDASLGEIDQYKTAHPHQFQVLSQPSTYLKQSFAKLRLNRIDSFLFTQVAVEYELALQGAQNEFVNAGCIDAEPIYAAFSPILPEQQLLALKTFYDKRMTELHAQGVIKQVMHSYGLSY